MKKLLALFALTVAISACDNGAATTSAAPASNGGVDEAKVREIVGEYLHDNPEAIIASLEKYQETEMKKEQEKSKNAIKENRDKFLNTKHSAAYGNLSSSSYVVEFFDYNCGYCKRANPVLKQLLAEQKDIKIVLIELPVLGPSSEIAAAAAVVVQLKAPEKYLAFHNKLMEFNGQKDLNIIKQIAREAEIRDIDFAEEIKKPEIAAAIEENRAIAQALGINGTPAFIVNDELIPGAVPYENIVDLLKKPAQQ